VVTLQRLDLGVQQFLIHGDLAGFAEVKQTLLPPDDAV